MKNLFFLILCFVVFTGCSSLDQEIIEDNKWDMAKDDVFQQEEDVELLEGNLRNEVINLRSLWKAFDEARQGHIDPTNNLKNSKYLLELKSFLSKRESLALSDGKLGDLLAQSDYTAVDKTMVAGGEEFHIRVIGYNVNFYEQVMTDIPSVKNKLIFMQCWNEDSFYFQTLSDGDIQYFVDFTPLEINNRLCILITGNACPYGPYPAFVWSWRLEEEGFYPNNVFDSHPYENEEYRLYGDAVFNTSSYQDKWMLHTNGSYLFAEKGKKDDDNRINLMNIECEIDDENKRISFISTDLQGEKTVMWLALVKDRFKVETGK